MVAATRSYCGSTVFETPADDERTGTGPPDNNDHVCVDRLGDVAGSRLVFNHLWINLRRFMEFERAGVRDPGDVVAGPARAHERGRAYFALSRLGQPVDGPGDAVDVLCLLAIPDHLVGQPAGRDDLVRRAQTRRLGHHRAGNCDSAICVSVPDAAIPRR